MDTPLGFNLEPFHRSIRKRQNAKAKFYFFDTGVCRALQNIVSTPLPLRTVEYGKAFEHFILLEIYKLNLAYEKRMRLSYLRINDKQEVGLIIETRKSEMLIEIKSYNRINGG